MDLRDFLAEILEEGVQMRMAKGDAGYTVPPPVFSWTRNSSDCASQTALRDAPNGSSNAFQSPSQADRAATSASDSDLAGWN
jgi:hypothetical protein